MAFNALQIMKLRAKNQLELDFDNMMIPHWTHYLSPWDVEALRKIATSKRLSGNMTEKLNRIKNIMNSRGFVRLAGGTNRVVYRHLEDTRFVAKVAIDSVGMTDNPAEFENQWFIRPYCAKMFYVTDCGTVGFAQRVLPITSKEEFKTAADDIFEILYSKIIGRYIIEDVGTNYFMNWGLTSIGPVLLDYPYIYELDGSAIICKNNLNGIICNGEIDYDAGLNELVCNKCRRKYLAKEMKKNQENNKIVISKGGKIPMNVSIVKGNKTLAKANNCDYIVKPSVARARLEESVKNSTLGAVITKNGKVYSHSESNEPKTIGAVPMDAKERMQDIMAQIKKNTPVEEEVKEEEVTTNLLTVAPVEEVEEVVEEEPVKEESKEEAPVEEVKTIVVEDRIEVSDSVEAKEAPTDNKDRKVIGKRKIAVESQFIPNEVESEY